MDDMLKILEEISNLVTPSNKNTFSEYTESVSIGQKQFKGFNFCFVSKTSRLNPSNPEKNNFVRKRSDTKKVQRINFFHVIEYKNYYLDKFKYDEILNDSTSRKNFPFYQININKIISENINITTQITKDSSTERKSCKLETKLKEKIKVKTRNKNENNDQKETILNKNSFSNTFFVKINQFTIDNVNLIKDLDDISFLNKKAKSLPSEDLSQKNHLKCYVCNWIFPKRISETDRYQHESQCGKEKRNLKRRNYLNSINELKKTKKDLITNNLKVVIEKINCQLQCKKCKKEFKKNYIRFENHVRICDPYKEKCTGHKRQRNYRKKCRLCH